MSDEPTYTYVKGQGWVAGFQPEYPSLTRDVGLYRVTGILRKPELGEHFFTDGSKTPLENTVGAMSDTYWLSKFTSMPLERILLSMPLWDTECSRRMEDWSRHTFIVMKIEPL